MAGESTMTLATVLADADEASSDSFRFNELVELLKFFVTSFERHDSGIRSASLSDFPNIASLSKVGEPLGVKVYFL